MARGPRLGVLTAAVLVAVGVAGPAVAADQSEEPGTRPSAPVILEPADLEWVSGEAGRCVRLRWTASTGPAAIDGYRITVDGDEAETGIGHVTSGSATQACIALSTLTRAPSEGPHTIHLVAMDVQGAASEAALRTVNVDLSTPGMPAHLAVATVPGSAEVTATWDEPTQGDEVHSWQVYLDGDWQHSIRLPPQQRSFTTTVSTEAFGFDGADTGHYIIVTPFDEHDLPGFAAQRWFYVDTTPPTSPVFTSPAEGTWLPGGPLRYTYVPASDAEYSIVNHSLLIDGHWVEYLPGTIPGPASERSGESSWTWQANSVDAFEPGLHTLQLSGRHRAGFAPTATIRYGIDPDPPQTPALSVPSTAVVGPIGLTWPALHDTLSGIAAVEVEVDGRVVLRPAISARAATVTLAAGRHTLRLTVTDRAGNRASSARSVSVLTPTPPRAPRITSPAAGSLLGRSARVTWAAAAPGPGARITGYRVRIDRRPSITVAADRRTTLFRLAPGTHVATVVALDSRGLTSAPATVRFRVR